MRGVIGIAIANFNKTSLLIPYKGINIYRMISILNQVAILSAEQKVPGDSPRSFCWEHNSIIVLKRDV